MIVGQEPGIFKYEKSLPEADSIFTMASQDLRERGWARLSRREEDYGDSMPWPKTNKLFRLRPHETTIWAGPNGSKKSLTVNWILGNLAFAGTKVFFASFELTVDDQIARLTRQFTDCINPERHRFDRLMDKLDENLCVYDFVGQIRPERALALARYAAQDLGCKHILIDNLTMVVPPGKDADEKGARFVAGLYQIGRDTGAHIHLICHVRKPEDVKKQLSRYDIRGTGAAPDQVDNVVMLQLNETKEENNTEPDIYMTIDKQRHGAHRGRMGFWFYERSLRLAESGINPPERYI
jgi:twinkle protein